VSLSEKWNYPKVSAIIPTFNCASFIKDTVESVLKQTVAFDELIIIDDCSTDDTCSILEDLLSKQTAIKQVVFKRQAANLGPSRVRDVGLSLATNDLIVYMDHDDIAEPTMLEELASHMLKIKHNEYGLVHSACSQIDEAGCFIPGIHRWQQVGTEEILGYEFVRNQILSMSGVLIKKAFLIKAGGFDAELRYSQDWDLWLRLAQTGGFGYVDQPLVRIRRHPGNTSKDISHFLEDELKVLSKYSLDFIQDAINKRHLPVENNYLDFASILIKLNRLNEAYNILIKTIELNPDFSSSYFYLGIYYLKKGCLEKAEQFFKQVLDIRTDNAAAQNNLGCIRALAGDLQGAEKFFAKAINQLPNYLDALSNKKILADASEVLVDDLKFTLRELRPVLLTYNP